MVNFLEQLVAEWYEFHGFISCAAMCGLVLGPAGGTLASWT